MLSQNCISVAYPNEHDLTLVFYLQSQTKQTDLHRELRDRLEEEDLKSKLHLSIRRNAMAMLAIVEQCILQLKEVKEIERSKTRIQSPQYRHLLLTVMRLRW